MYPAIQVSCDPHQFFHRRPHRHHCSVKHSLREDRRSSAGKQRWQQRMQSRAQSLFFSRIGQVRRDQRLHDAQMTRCRLGGCGRGRQIDLQRYMAKRSALSIEESFGDCIVLIKIICPFTSSVSTQLVCGTLLKSYVLEPRSKASLSRLLTMT